MAAGTYEDDGDPGWEDIETRENTVKVQDHDINLEGSWTTKRGRELFIDTISPSRTWRGELGRKHSTPLFRSGTTSYGQINVGFRSENMVS